MVGYNCGRARIIIVLLSIKILGCQLYADDFPILTGPYLGQEPPGLIPEIFAPGIISTELHDDAAPIFTPDQNEVFFRVIGNINGRASAAIFHMKIDKGIWTHPQIASFVARDTNLLGEGKMALSPDGRRLYFSSMRPENQYDEDYDMNIWYVDKTAKGWSDPVELGRIINSDQNEMVSSVGIDGTLYLDVESTGKQWYCNSYFSRFVDGEFIAPVRMDSTLTSIHFAGDFIMSHDQSYIIISAVSEKGFPDLFVSFKNAEGKWGNPINLGEKVNSNKVDKFAGFSPDGKYLFFVSRRDNPNKNPKRLWQVDYFNGEQQKGGADIYWVDAKIIEELQDK